MATKQEVRNMIAAIGNPTRAEIDVTIAECEQIVTALKANGASQQDFARALAAELNAGDTDE